MCWKLFRDWEYHQSAEKREKGSIMSAPADPYLLLLLVTHPAHYLSQGANISTAQCLKITQKSHSTMRAKRATFTFWVNKSELKNTKKWSILTSFQIVLPGRSLLIRQKLVENTKIVKCKCDIFGGQKFIQNAKNGQFGRVFENLKLAVK